MRTTPRNSRSLERYFPTVYRRFFSTQQKIASAPYTFFWAGEFSGLYDEGLTINQQLPFRLYVGLQPRTQSGFSIEQSYLGYDTTSHAFTERLLDAHFCTTLENLLSQRYPQQQYDITLLCEVPFGFGMGSNAALGSALALLLEPEHVQEAAQEIAAAMQHGISSGSSVATALSSKALPIFHTHTTATPHDHIPQKSTPLACDVALVSTGIPNYGESAIRASEAALDSLRQRSARMKKIIDIPGHDLTSRYLAGLNATTEIMMLNVLQLIEEGGHDGALEQITTAVNQFHTLLETIHPFQLVATRFRNYFLHLYSLKDVNPPIGVKVSGYGAGETLLLIMPEGTYRGMLQRAIDELNKSDTHSYALEYSSWQDGSNTQPASVLQDISQQIVHRHFRGTIIQARLFQNGSHTMYTLPIDGVSMFLEKNYTDITVDLLNQKISIAGKTLKSTQIPSQKAAAHVLNLLLLSKNQTASSDEISGSYGLNRYDLQGKIIIPLRKVIQEMLGHDLHLTLRGSGSEFTVKLEPLNLSFLVTEIKA